MWIDHAHTGLSGNTLIAARLVAAFVGAVASSWPTSRSAPRVRSRSAPGRARVEAGLRRGRRRWRWSARCVAATVTGPAVGSTLVEATGPTSTSTTTTLVPLPVPTVAFYGDALASTLETSAKSWAARTGKIKVVDGVASPTCGIDRDQTSRTPAARPCPSRPSAAPGTASGPRPPASAKPDIAVVVTGISELADHRQPSDPAFTGPGNQGYDYQLLLLMHKAVEALAASGTKVIWLNLPNFSAGSGAPSDASRVAAFNKLLTVAGPGDPRPGHGGRTWAPGSPPTAAPGPSPARTGGGPRPPTT